ncbi:hypothetical protein [Bartonella sp. CB74]|uniref:hypothetical protein n=1 Tax=Bartonella sp. CB74 TaxID=3113620 RepID=UPI002F96D9F1
MINGRAVRRWWLQKPLSAAFDRLQAHLYVLLLRMIELIYLRLQIRHTKQKTNCISLATEN